MMDPRYTIFKLRKMPFIKEAYSVVDLRDDFWGCKILKGVGHDSL